MTSTAMAMAMNKVYKIMDGLTIKQIKEMRDVHGHKMLKLGTEAYARYVYQCDYMIDKKQNESA